MRKIRRRDRIPVCMIFHANWLWFKTCPCPWFIKLWKWYRQSSGCVFWLWRLEYMVGRIKLPSGLNGQCRENMYISDGHEKYFQFGICITVRWWFISTTFISHCLVSFSVDNTSRQHYVRYVHKRWQRYLFHNKIRHVIFQKKRRWPHCPFPPPPPRGILQVKAVDQYIPHYLHISYNWIKWCWTNSSISRHPGK